MGFDDLDKLLKEEGGVPKKKAERLPEVLVVDDDIAMRKSLGVLLAAKFTPIICATAEQGLRAAHPRVCAAILDVKMKDQDGFWLCNELRKEYLDLPIIFYSAYQDAMDPYEIINKFRPFAYIVKDSDPERLLSSVDLAVTMHKMVLRNRRLIEKLKKR